MTDSNDNDGDKAVANMKTFQKFRFSLHDERNAHQEDGSKPESTGGNHDVLCDA